MRSAATVEARTVPAETPGSEPASLRGLIFDMADVLYDATVWRRWLLQLLARLGVHADYQAFYTAWDRDYLTEVHCGRREFNEAFQAFLFDRGLTWAQIDEVEAAGRIRREELDRNVRPFPCVTAALRQLAADGLALAVLTNAACPADGLQAKLNRLGLSDLFSAVWSSLDLEATKPDSKCYQAALESLQLPAAPRRLRRARGAAWPARSIGLAHRGVQL